MAVVLFGEAGGADEHAYRDWLDAHADGRVVNLRREPDPAYAVLHRATCWTIGFATRREDTGPYTGRAYVKACAAEEHDLLAWVRWRQGAGFSKRCRHCGA
ncbi:MAG: hypothetical protein KGL52_17085 [Rhodospirillales bacterium]|nr:hypothetical protein [Rhodospirillales bacterium]